MLTTNGNTITKTDPHRHKYGSAMAEYLDQTDGAHDTFTGESDAPMGAVSLVGKRLILSDSRGFVDVDTYPSADSARAVFDAIDAWYCVWSDDEDDDYIGNAEKREQSLTLAENYTRYVIACAVENLTAHTSAMWLVHGCPTGPLG